MPGRDATGPYIRLGGGVGGGMQLKKTQNNAKIWPQGAI